MDRICSSHQFSLSMAVSSFVELQISIVQHTYFTKRITHKHSQTHKQTHKQSFRHLYIYTDLCADCCSGPRCYSSLPTSTPSSSNPCRSGILVVFVRYGLSDNVHKIFAGRASTAAPPPSLQWTKQQQHPGLPIIPIRSMKPKNWRFGPWTNTMPFF